MTDITKVLKYAFLHPNEYGDFAPMVGIFANRGSGKTGMGFMLMNLLMIGDDQVHKIDDKKYHRSVAIFEAPDRIIDEIELALDQFKGGNQLAKRFRLIDDIDDVRPYEIVYIDEAGKIFDGKLALRKEKREIMGGFTYARHNLSPIIYCTTKPKVMLDLRTLTDIFIFKRMNPIFINSLIKEGFDIVKRNKRALLNLGVQYALIYSNYKHLPIEGGLNMPLSKFCPWFTDGISKNMEGQSFATERSRELEIKEGMIPLIDEIIDKYGSELRKGYASKLVKGYLFNEKPKEYEKYKKYISEIVASAFQKWHDNLESAIDSPRKEKLFIPQVPDGFESFLEEFYIENLPNSVRLSQKTSYPKETIIEVLKQWALGIGQRDIRVNSDQHRNNIIPVGMIGKIIKLFRDGDGSQTIQNNLRLFNVHEHWIAKITKGKVISGIGKPDIMFEVGDQKFPGECKFYDDISVSIALDKLSKLKPSYEFCLEHNISYFPLFFRNPKWTDDEGKVIDFIYKVDLLGPELFTIRKDLNHILYDFHPEVFFKSLLIEQ